MKEIYTLRASLIFFVLFIPIQLLAQKPVSFLYHQSLIFVKVKVNEKKDLLFLMDTGANISSIDNSTAQLLKLPVLKDGDSVVGTAGKEAIKLCRTKTFQLGGTILKNMTIHSRDLSRIMTPGYQKLNGILGTDFLKQYVITIDYGKKTLLLSKTRPKVAREKIVHFDMVSGIPRFEARFNDTLTSHIYYNSGVSLLPSRDIYVNVSHKQWSALKSHDKFLTSYTTLDGDGVGGRVKLPVVKINNILLNGLAVEKPNIVIQPREGYLLSDNSIGFFGNNLFEKYRKITIDFPSNRVIMHTINKNTEKHTYSKQGVAMQIKKKR